MAGMVAKDSNDQGIAQVLEALQTQRALLADMAGRIQELEQANIEQSNSSNAFEDSFQQPQLQETFGDSQKANEKRRSSMDGKSHSQIEHGEFKEFKVAEMAGKVPLMRRL